MRILKGEKLREFVSEAAESASPSALYVINVIYAEVKRLEKENAELKKTVREIIFETHRAKEPK